MRFWRVGQGSHGGTISAKILECARNKVEYGKDVTIVAKKDYDARAEEMLVPVTQQFGVSIYDVEFVKEGSDYYLRAYIDKEGGITIDDCVDVSRKLSDELDKGDFIAEAYILEVSSPGLGRKLKKDKEFMRSIGKDIDIKFYKPVDGAKEVSGKLVGFTKEDITIEKDGTDKAYARSEIASVKLSLDF